MTRRSIFWFRRDLRLSDNPALMEAIADCEELIPLFIMDDQIANRAGDFRRSYLAESLQALDKSLNGSLHVISGEPVSILQQLKEFYSADAIYVAQEFAPYGVARDLKVEQAGIELRKTGSGYAVSPGRTLKDDGTPYKVFTPFFKAWVAHSWRGPIAPPKKVKTVSTPEKFRNFPDWELPRGATLQPAGETAALKRWKEFQSDALATYGEQRNYAGIDGTSKLSPHLRWGEIHPRTLLHSLGEGDQVFRKEIAWREFYADVLHHNPHTSRDYYLPRFASMKYESPGKNFISWCDGRTGYPFVDAAMRQLRSEGWMHNRTRMVVASFLVKDLHMEWQHGANFFMKYLIDNDVASNSHGWQWTAGCGTDASPYFRIFNPVEQGKRFDPKGDYIRKYVPEIAHLSDAHIHEPWLFQENDLKGYPNPIVDHAAERIESLARLAEIKVFKPES